MKKFSLFLGVLLLLAGAGVLWGYLQMPKVQAQVMETLSLAKTAKLDLAQWNEIETKAKLLPSLPGVVRVKRTLLEAKKIAEALNGLKDASFLSIPDEGLPTELNFTEFFEAMTTVGRSMEKIQNNIESIPTFLLSESQLAEREHFFHLFTQGQHALAQVKKIERIFSELAQKEARVLILLQNQNEPRSTGGFMGSLLVLDFTKDQTISWKFADIYELDRLIPQDTLESAPPFFHGLSPVISLRDANFWPNFPTSAERISDFYVQAGEKEPTVIVGINLNLIREILKITGPVYLDQWGITLDEHNFDLGLQFLVESKIAGRYDVKSPVVAFGQEVFKKIGSLDLSNKEATDRIDFATFWDSKNILAWSSIDKTQRQFEFWDIDGALKRKSDADNVLQFDFVSVGANKSEKFMWTKISHDSRIGSDGEVENTLEIKRTHALQSNEIPNLLGIAGWFENVKSLLNEDLYWKLGAGENRTVIRVLVPQDAILAETVSPSGPITTAAVDFSPYWKVFEVPAFVLPGESLDITLKYQTQISRGSHNWRPYFLQLFASPGKEKVRFVSTISTKDGGRFEAETDNIGRPETLIDQDFRAVVKFEE